MSAKRTGLDKEARAAQRRASIDRRRFLRGVGAMIALPAFHSLLPGGRSLFAATPTGPAGPLATTPTGAPLRTVYVYVPNGAIPAAWWPDGQPGAKDYKLGPTLKPLEDLRDKFQILGGLECRAADPGPDGGGDHARASGSFLTGVRTKKSSTQIATGVSIDQVIAQHVGHLTPFRSLELTCDSVRTAGACDNGYSCAYSYNLSWRTPHNPVAPEPNPRLVFERMFGYGLDGAQESSLNQRLAQQKSILDFVMEDARAVERELNPRDRAKLDEYLTGLRDIEQRIEKAERRPEPETLAGVKAPRGIPDDYGEYIQLMFDMLVLAFQTDQTRVATFMLAHEASNRPMPFLGVAEGHHNLSHHGDRVEMIEKVKIIDRWYIEQFGKFLRKLDATRDVDGNSLLANSMILYGSGISDGDRHYHTNLPILLAGGGGGTLTPGRYIRKNDTPITNLYLAMADRMGCHDLNSHGDSTGRLEGI